MRRIQLFEDEGVFIIRHYLPRGRMFDQSFESEIDFLETLATFLYVTQPEKIGLDVEMGVGYLVIPFLEGLAYDLPPSEKRQREVGVRG